jgi:hypothetical protein
MLIDEGSNINLLYRTSMEKLGIPVAQLKPRRITFHGIVPGLLCFPMGRIQLDVLFKEKGNSHREPIWFDTVDLSSPYHVLLGCPALAKFMVMPHYVPQDEAPRPSRCEHHHGMLQEIDGVCKSQLEAGRGIGHHRGEASAPPPCGANSAGRADTPVTGTTVLAGHNTKRIPLDVNESAKVVAIGPGLYAK